MLLTKLIHPKISEVLARAGHHATVLIADGNYPASTTLGPNATLISLNLAPGVVGCTQVLQSILTAVPIESAAVMGYDKTGTHRLPEPPPIWSEFASLLRIAGASDELKEIERFQFYRESQQDDVCTTIATADQRVFANLLLTIGVVKTES